MNMIDQSRMATPPAPQPRYLRRLRVASAILCMLTAVGVAAIEPIRQFNIYAVGGVVVAMVGAIVTVALYWIFRRRVERAYWTPARESEHLEGVVRSIDLRRQGENRGRVTPDRRVGTPEGVFTRLWRLVVSVRGPRARHWWTPR